MEETGHMAGARAIALDKVTVRYAARGEPSLRDFSFEVSEGECVLLTGGSGCGKSTVIRLLNGLVPHVYEAEVSGSVSVLGHTPAERPLQETGRTVSTVFQNPRTQFFCTEPLSEMAFGGENAGADPAGLRARVARVADRVGVAHLAQHSMFTLSGGEKQRVALASAVCDQPRIYLLDEPTANLDDEAVQELRSTLTRLRDSGATLVIAEHRLHYLRGLVDRVVRMDAGRTAQTYSSADFWNIPGQTRRTLGLRSLHPPATAKSPKPAADEHSGLVCDHPRFGELPFPRGMVTALVGRNGVGKTHTARILSGLEKSPARVTLDGRPLTRRQRTRRAFLAAQDVNRQLFGPSVREELTLGRQGIAPSAVDAALRRLDIDQLADRHPLSLSGGQQQRVAIASALVEGREIYIFDEPSSGLDYRAMQSVSGVLTELAASGKILILITHDHELADACAHALVSLSAPSA
ncbi:ABC transporter ATP-binding protein [Streptomyces natalensis]|nr:ABC transporter ATP-binding protein [Streptomyces natalensis]